jgi:NhaP-type Na+/H+ or K+/H+ antiporter
LLQTITGAILVRSVVSIRSYLVSKGASDYIDTNMLLKHAIAFGIYLASTVVFLSGVIYNTFAGTQKSQELFDLARAICAIGNCIS